METRALAYLGGQANKLGEVIDISKGGLAFRYLSVGRRPKGTFAIDILSTENGVRLENLAVKIVSDAEMATEIPFSFLSVRRLGAQFEGLTGPQTVELDEFIRKHGQVSAS